MCSPEDLVHIDCKHDGVEMPSMIFDSISKGTCSQILRPMFQAITRPYSISSALTLMRSHVEANRHRPQAAFDAMFFAGRQWTRYRTRRAGRQAERRG